MKNSLAIAICLALIAISSGASGENPFVYKWTDAKGAIHISNSFKAIPQPYREHARKIKLISVNYPKVGKMAGFAEASGTARVNFNPSRRGIIVPAVFNGVVKRDVLVDTGSEWVTITTKLAKALGYDTGKSRKTWFQTQSGPVQAPVVELDRLAIGGAEVKGFKAAVIDFEGRGPVSAVVGMNFLSAFVFEIDTYNGNLILTTPEN